MGARNLPVPNDRGFHHSPDEEFIDLGQSGDLVALGSVESYPMRIRKITTTDEAKTQVVLETEGASEESLAQLKNMLSLQQACPVLVSMEPVLSAQREMFE